MEHPRAYIETSVFRYFHDERTTPEGRAIREMTREWVEAAPQKYELVTSEAVPYQLGLRPALAQSLPLLPITPAVLQIAASYARRRIFPEESHPDRLHLAVASYHGCDFLVTWSFRTLANANLLAAIRAANRDLSVPVPTTLQPCPMEDQHEDYEYGTHDDPVEEIRAIRRRISARFGHDVVRYCAYLMEYQKQFADRLITTLPGYGEEVRRRLT